MLTEFNPVNYSIQENKFLFEHVGEPSVVALKAIVPQKLPNAHPKDKNPVWYPDGVVPAAVKPVLDGVYELQELAKHEGLEWVGVEAIKEAILVYLAQAEKWSEQRGRRGAPRFPSMSVYDGKNRPHYMGSGSDSGFVSTYFDAKGNRLPFILHLVPDNHAQWVPDWATPEQAVATANPALKVDPRAGILVNNASNRIECLVCGHTESFKPESRSSFNAARARTSKHLRSSRDEVSLHREVHANEFGA